MSSEDWQKLNELFAEALEIAPVERTAFVASIENVEIKNELESLLAAHESSSKFLNKNAVELSAKTLLANDSETFVGREIGHFKIIKEIGRGGMGAVYLAERINTDFTQKAALKLIKRGMDTDFIVQRFQTERRILSRLNHPYIAKLLDGGTTDDNLPYFVMEYVEGRNLKEFCQTENPFGEAKLELFCRICEAVQYAHRNLVVHRDLKPSNIIVGEDKMPKLLDFGIAKVLDTDAENTEKTTTEFRLLTPKYASPEQLRGELVGTQSDVFSLGVLLREILSEPPALAGGLNANSLNAKQNPSATADGSDLNAELKTIIAKATHEDTTRRYVSVEQFSEDIRRFQNNLPILAQSDSYTYRSRKFIKRHRFGAFAAALILLTLLGGISATFWQFRRAQNERKLAEQRFNDVRSLANSVIFDLHDEIQNLPGSTKARKLLVEKALEYLNKLEVDANNDPNLQHEIAMAYLKIADVQGQIFEASLLETDQAEINYRKALVLAEKSVQSEPQNFEFRRDAGTIYLRFARAKRGANDLTEALTLEKRAVEILAPLVVEKPDDLETRRLWLNARSGVADITVETGEIEPTIPLYEQNLKDTENAVADAPEDVKLNKFYAVVIGRYAIALFRLGESQTALDLLLKSQKISRKFSDENPNETNLLRNLAVSCEDTGKMASETGSNALAETNFQEEIRLMEKIAAADSGNIEANYDVASAHNNYADFLEKNNRWKESSEHRQKVLNAIVPLEKNENNPELYTADFFEFYAKFARVAAKLGKKDLASKYCEKAQSLDFKIEKTSGETQNLYTNDFVALGDAFQDLGNKESAKNCYAKAVETWQNLQTNGRLYPNQIKNLDETLTKLTNLKH